MRLKMSTRDAQAWAEALRYEALRQKRAAGEPRAPMRARPGQEAAFWKAPEAAQSAPPSSAPFTRAA